jgi:hypothetical protein
MFTISSLIFRIRDSALTCTLSRGRLTTLKAQGTLRPSSNPRNTSPKAPFPNGSLRLYDSPSAICFIRSSCIAHAFVLRIKNKNQGLALAPTCGDRCSKHSTLCVTSRIISVSSFSHAVFDSIS